MRGVPTGPIDDNRTKLNAHAPSGGARMGVLGELLIVMFALGKRIRNGFKDDPWREVVGVAADVHDNGVQEKPPSFACWPAMMEHFEGEAVHVTRFAVFAVRTKRAATESFGGSFALKHL